MTRRQLMGSMFACSASALLPIQAVASTRPSFRTRTLRFRHYNKRDVLSVDYWTGGAYDGPGLRSINHFLRDRRVDKSYRMDLTLVDGLYELLQQTGADAPIDILSAYRTPGTNQILGRKYRGVATNSFHVRGMAVDMRIEDVRLRHVRDAALDLKIGGVGFYPKRGFVHLDVGPHRAWRG